MRDDLTPITNLDFSQLPIVLERLKLLANPERLQILCSLGKSSLNVGEIQDLTAIGQPTLSQQLGILLKAGVVDTDKQGKYVYYRITDDKITQMIGVLYGLYCDKSA